MRAGLYGNIGALLMGAAGRMEDALEYTEKSIEAGREINIPDSTLTAGTARHVTCVLSSLEAPLCIVRAGGICHAPESISVQLSLELDIFWPFNGSRTMMAGL